ncbi:MAG: pentapeptide repeat-containing protein [Anaerolineae bacterium]
MDDQMYLKIQQYQQALKALQRSVEHSIQNETYEGTGKMAVKSYQGIQRKVAELLPEDFYVTDTLALEMDSELKERHMLSQVQLAANQLLIYLDGLLREHRAMTGTTPADWGELKNWGRSFGRDLQDQIINMTRATIERAVRNVDIDVQGPDSLRGAVMEGAKLEGANFSGRNLKDAILKGANLRGANFSGANLVNVDMEGADCEDANFSGANLKDTNLPHVNFGNANLTGANFKNAHLEGANLAGAKIAGANFKDANLKGATMPRGEEFHNEGDLVQYGASARGASTGRAHVRIEITDDEDKPKNDDQPPTSDEDLV